MVWLTAAGALSQTPPQSGGTPTPPVPATPSEPAQTTAPAPSSILLPAQAPPIDKNAPELTQKDAPTIFKTRVDMVSVPVVVRDSKGHVVGTLTKENFHVFDRGKPQEIVRFTVEKSGEQTAKAAKTVDAVPIEGEPAGMPDVPERFLVYLFDDMNLPFEDLVRSRDAAGRQLAKLAKTDRAAIYTTSGQNWVDFTDDIDKLQADLLLIRNRSFTTNAVHHCPDISFYMADRISNYGDSQAMNVAIQEAIACLGLPPGAQTEAAMIVGSVVGQVLSDGQQATHVNLLVLKDVVRRMSAMPGQRIIVLISPGFITPTEYQSDKSDILDRAIKANVVINSLDARGLWTDPSFDASQQGASTQAFLTLKQQYDRIGALTQGEVLAEMADGTGGKFFENNNDLDQGMSELAAAPEYHYLIAFSPQNLKLDGSFHALKVTVKTNPPVSFNIQARKGYYAPKKASNAEETAKGEIEASVFSRDELSELPVELHTQFFKSSDKDATLSVVCRMDPRHMQFKKADGRNSNIVTVVSAVFDRNGNLLSGIVKTVDIKMKDETLAKLMTTGVMTLKTNFSVPPGSYMIRLVVRDSEGQMMSALNGAVAIP
jgi:VWFA-related protein